MESTGHDNQPKRKGLRVAVGIAAVFALVGVTSLALRETPDDADNRSHAPNTSRSSKPVPSANPEPSRTHLVPSCSEIKRQAIEWKNDNFEIDLGTNCSGTLTFHNPGMPHKHGELPFSHMPVKFSHNEADITIEVGEPDHKIPNWDRYTPRPGRYDVALIKHNAFFELRLTNKADKPYGMCAPWRPIPLCGGGEASLRRH